MAQSTIGDFGSGSDHLPSIRREGITASREGSMNTIHSSAWLKIHPGKLDEFKDVARRCMESVRTKDTGTLQYDWFLNDAGTVCAVREAYRDSDAVFEHMGNLGDTLGDLMAVCEMDLEIYGTPSQPLIDALTEAGAKFYVPMSE
ncbi:MAG: hypothetical protein HKN13_02825 [Rhodothermales bacterium]|nr:hypothetical protein [Rhodothermales bacterium]